MGYVAPARRDALRHRRDARAARRERLHYRGAGDGRDRHAERRGPRLDYRRRRFRRQALLVAAGSETAGPQAACRTPAGRSVGAAGGRRAGDGGAERAGTALRSDTSPRRTAVPTLGRPFALALVAGGRARIGSTLHVPTPGGAVDVTVTDPVFFDKAGERLRMRAAATSRHRTAAAGRAPAGSRRTRLRVRPVERPRTDDAPVDPSRIRGRHRHRTGARGAAADGALPIRHRPRSCGPVARTRRVADRRPRNRIGPRRRWRPRRRATIRPALSMSPIGRGPWKSPARGRHGA